MQAPQYTCVGALAAHEHSLTLPMMASTAGQPVPIGCVAPHVRPGRSGAAGCKPADTWVGHTLSSSATGVLPMTGQRPSPALNCAARSSPRGGRPAVGPMDAPGPVTARAQHSKARGQRAHAAAMLSCSLLRASADRAPAPRLCPQSYPAPALRNGAPARSRRSCSTSTALVGHKRTPALVPGLRLQKLPTPASAPRATDSLACMRRISSPCCCRRAAGASATAQQAPAWPLRCAPGQGSHGRPSAS